MSRTALLLVVIAALVAVGWYWHQQPARVEAKPGARAAVHVIAPAEEPTATRARKRPAAVPELPPQRKSPDYAAQYRHSDDLLSFLEALAPAAADGDIDAMYYLAVASRRCTREYATLFGPPGKEKSLELALETDYWTRYYEQTARRIYAQCKRFKSAPDNSFTEWQNLLEAAGEAGSGSAKALLVFEMQQGMIRIDDPAERVDLKSEIRALAKEAIRTREPEALYHLAYVETISGKTGTPADMGSVWMLAACQRGMACGRDTELFQFFCRWDPECQPTETMVDLFRRREGAGFEELQRRANELNERLDAGRFDEIIP